MVVPALFEIEVVRDKHLILKVKSSKEWEEALAASSKVIEEPNAFRTEKTLKAYGVKFGSEIAGYEALGYNVWNDNQYLNFAIFKMVGISEGVEIKINSLVDLAKFEKALRSACNTLKGWYATNIKPATFKLVLSYSEL